MSGLSGSAAMKLLDAFRGAGMTDEEAEIVANRKGNEIAIYFRNLVKWFGEEKKEESKPGRKPSRIEAFGGGNAYNFSKTLQDALMSARRQAEELKHEYVGTEHLLLGLIVRSESDSDESNAVAVLLNLNIDLERIRSTIIETVKKGKGQVFNSIDLPYTGRAKQVLELAMTVSRELNHSWIGSGHLLLGLLREEKGIAAQILTDLGLTVETAAAELVKITD